MPTPLEIQLRPEQAKRFAARVQAYNQAVLKQQEAEADVRELLGFVIDGVAPLESLFVGIDPETGILTIQPPEASP